MGFKEKKKIEEVSEEAPTAEELVDEELKKDKPSKGVTVNDVLMDHEQRLVQMEAKWFRLGGI